MVEGVTHGELAHVQLAKEHGAGLVQFADHRGVFIGHKVLQDVGAAGGEYPLGVELVFNRHRHAVHRAAVLAGDDLLLGQAGVGHRPVGGHGDVGVQLAVNLGNPFQIGLGHLHGRNLAGLDEGCQFGGREKWQL